VKKNSLFRDRYDGKIQDYKLRIQNDENVNDICNYYYEPRLFNLIDDKLHVLPLWTTVIIYKTGKILNNDYLIKSTRLDNNPVENYFGNLKNKILGKNKVFPSELCSLNYQDLLSKKIEYYNEIPTSSSISAKGTILYYKINQV
jgi:hypothetical protein